MNAWQMIALMTAAEACVLLGALAYWRDGAAALWRRCFAAAPPEPGREEYALALADVFRRLRWLRDKGEMDKAPWLPALEGALEGLRAGAADFVRSPEGSIHHGHALLGCCEAVARAFEQHLNAAEAAKATSAPLSDNEPQTAADLPDELAYAAANERAQADTIFEPLQSDEQPG